MGINANYIADEREAENLRYARAMEKVGISHEGIARSFRFSCNLYCLQRLL